MNFSSIHTLKTIAQHPARRRKSAATALLLILTTLAANATPITIPNYSFETPGATIATSTNFTVLPGWVFNVKGGSQFGSASIASNFSNWGSATGRFYAVINNDQPNVTDTITSAASLGTITPLTEYTLTVAIGNNNKSDSSLYGAPGNVSLSLLANGNVIATQEVLNGTIPNGTFEDFTVTYTTPSSGSVIGDNLTIQLATLPQQGSAYQPAFDTVRLDATTVDPPPVVPEPSSWALLASGVLALCWLMRRQAKARTVAMTALIVAVSVSTATATPITIPNASFSSPSTPTNTKTTPGLIPGWTANLGTGDEYGTLSIAEYFSIPPTVTSGNNFADIISNPTNTPGTLTSAASLGTLAASTQYTLTVAIGNVGAKDSEEYASPGPVSFSLLGNGTPLATDVVPNGTVANNTFEDFTLTYDSPSSGAVIGENLTIQLEAMPQTQFYYSSAFNNVTLDASPLGVIAAPEPSTWALSLIVLGALALCLMRRHQLS